MASSPYVGAFIYQNNSLAAPSFMVGIRKEDEC